MKAIYYNAKITTRILKRTRGISIQRKSKEIVKFWAFPLHKRIACHEFMQKPRHRQIIKRIINAGRTAGIVIRSFVNSCKFICDEKKQEKGGTLIS